MLVIPGRYGKDTCDGYSRRAVLRVGSSALAGLSVATLLENAARGAEVSDEEARYGGKGFARRKVLSCFICRADRATSICGTQRPMSRTT
ncbi:MAG: hypothetical protein U0936_07985 [Planctomycetaceae bacterium]